MSRPFTILEIYYTIDIYNIINNTEVLVVQCCCWCVTVYFNEQTEAQTI